MSSYGFFDSPAPVAQLSTPVGEFTVRTFWTGTDSAARPGDPPLVWVVEIHPGDPERGGVPLVARVPHQVRAQEVHWATVRRLERWLQARAAARPVVPARSHRVDARRRRRGWWSSQAGDH